MASTSLAASEQAQYPEHDLSEFPVALKGKRILLCTESFGPVNGVSRTTLMLVNHLRDHGVQVAVVAPHNHTNHNTFSPPPSPSLSPVDKQPEVRLTGYPLPFNPELSIVYPVRNSTLYARTFGSDAPPDLIYLASPASLGFQVMLQLRQQPKEKQIPIICNFQTDLAGYCSILFPAPLSYAAVFAFDAVQSYLFRHSSIKTIFYPSRFVRRYLEGQRVQPSKLEILTRGVNTTMFNPSRRSEALRKEIAPNGEIIFVTVSRIAGEKGFDFLAKVAKELDARGLAFKMVIVGGNRNPDVEKEVQELFDPLREKATVSFAGFKVGEDLATYYASGDVFLHCSVTETFGLVVLESMASGVPVVARDEGGPSDIVADGKTGYLIPPDDLDGFVAKAVRLAEDHQLRFKMAKDARLAACEATWDKINNKVAWRMADTIAQREREQGFKPQPAKAVTTTAQQLVPVYGWLMMNNALRETVTRGVVDARLMGGLGVILSFWVVTGAYVVFSEGLLWAKGRIRKSAPAN
ncbi:glycosyltransferase family 4 [Trichoderma reesei QM6a]|jgi:glycosyltransferase involved in cell wall biosynthesis|uniref:Glycosyltransferase family 4 n=2 Tax=Hypocrea jecorina TaxID=51453 RepID=G0RTX9_HYPJQ|nr:glycosyltransferase family 4 [Trichoderma reesei QM6a]EGR45354.1 glycosyltransferase family 4 [Trichoderma reesei QM6a]ETR98056.1 putative glycosyl transferase [Trichoderma reesei RUT C-30]